jgi:IS1 family transposase
MPATYQIQPTRKRYGCLEIDELWTYVGRKTDKAWLIYAYHRESGGIAAYVWGKRGLKTAGKLKKRLGVTYDRIACDERDSFLTAFGREAELRGKRHTVGIEGNNCRLRHRVRRVFRKACCFSKKLLSHWKAFSMAFFTSIMATFKVHHTLHNTTNKIIIWDILKQKIFTMKNTTK